MNKQELYEAYQDKINKKFEIMESLKKTKEDTEKKLSGLEVALEIITREICLYKELLREL
jgi:hypothetical protein